MVQQGFEVDWSKPVAGMGPAVPNGDGRRSQQQSARVPSAAPKRNSEDTATTAQSKHAVGIPVDLDDFLLNPGKYDNEADDDDASQESLFSNDETDFRERSKQQYWEEVEPRRFFDNPTNRRLLDNDASNIPGAYESLRRHSWFGSTTNASTRQCNRISL
jgi:hypothetical protein